MAVASVFAETKTVTFSDFSSFLGPKGEKSDGIFPLTYKATAEDFTFTYYGLKKNSAGTGTQSNGSGGFPITQSKKYWFGLTSAPENATISSISIPTAYDGGYKFLLYYSEETSMEGPSSMYNYVELDQLRSLNIDFKTIDGGKAANAKCFVIYNVDTRGNLVLYAPITVTFDIAEAKPVEPYKAPVICGSMGELTTGDVVTNGEGVWFDNWGNENNGEIWYATSTDNGTNWSEYMLGSKNSWGDYEGPVINGEPGSSYGIRAYVKGEVEGQDSPVSEVFVTIADEWAMPTFIYNGEALAEGTDIELETVVAGKIITVVNPTEEGMLYVETPDDSFYGEPGMNMEVTIPQTAPSGELSWSVQAKVTGYGKSDSQQVTLWVGTIEPDNSTAIEAIEAMGGKAIYYNLQGQRISKPERGCYVVVIGGKASKVIK